MWIALTGSQVTLYLSLALMYAHYFLTASFPVCFISLTPDTTEPTEQGNPSLYEPTTWEDLSTADMPDSTPQPVYTRESLNLTLGDSCYFATLDMPHVKMTFLERICFCYLYCLYRPLTAEEMQERLAYLARVAHKKLMLRLHHYLPLVVINSLVCVLGIAGESALCDGAQSGMSAPGTV